jgi:hypothetical protein
MTESMARLDILTANVKNLHNDDCDAPSKVTQQVDVIQEISQLAQEMDSHARLQDTQ